MIKACGKTFDSFAQLVEWAEAEFGIEFTHDMESMTPELEAAAIAELEAVHSAIEEDKEGT